MTTASAISRVLDISQVLQQPLEVVLDCGGISELVIDARLRRRQELLRVQPRAQGGQAPRDLIVQRRDLLLDRLLLQQRPPVGDHHLLAVHDGNPKRRSHARVLSYSTLIL
ncbi:MAG TPA: hypothetical protein VM098_07150 [Phycisphaerae bacterium]|nr:hypothetical protein [Phycisphaerae bacterium]